MAKTTKALVPTERVLSAIVLIRGEKVLLDVSLAEMYGVETRFPADFMFQLSAEEFDDLRSQTVISSSWGGRRTPPYAFTEQGVAMLSSVLRSRRAVSVNVEIMRAFVRLRRMAEEHRDLMLRIDALESRYDQQFATVFDAIRALISEQTRPRRRIGFRNGRTASDESET